MTTVVMSALGVAAGLVGLFCALRRRAVPLSRALARLDRRPTGDEEAAEAGPRTAIRRPVRYLTARLATAVAENEFARSRMEPLLEMAGSTALEVSGQIVLGALIGLVLPGLAWLVVTTAGVALPFVVPVWVSLVGGAAGAVLPVRSLRRRAHSARVAARRGVGGFLNLVALSLAGGMGIEGALHSSARIGVDDVSRRIGVALATAQDAGEPPWDALDRLGRRMGVNELTELAATVGLAGGVGARVRSTIEAKARSIRQHELAREESEANALTERLFLPGILLLIGFLIFMAYPAVARISSGL